jgi:ElaA protein
MDKLRWLVLEFNSLEPAVLYEILRLRSEVFVVEQQCVYLDLDGRDQQSLHLCGWLNEELIAYTRLLPPNLAYPEASIGRVVTKPSHRKHRFGRELMEVSIETVKSKFSTNCIRIGAQAYLQKFYESFGFISTGKEYLEDGIPHIEMILR